VAADANLDSVVVVVVVVAAGLQLRIHEALVGVEVVDHVAVGDMPVATMNQHSDPTPSSVNIRTCCPPSIAPYVPGLYPLATCCWGWPHCWFGA
jgi:hypothetical protein